MHVIVLLIMSETLLSVFGFSQLTPVTDDTDLVFQYILVTKYKITGLFYYFEVHVHVHVLVRCYFSIHTTFICAHM